VTFGNCYKKQRKYMDILILATFLVALFSSLLSGLASGGGGFIMGPWWLVLGLSPAQAVACGSFTGTGMSLSSLHALRRGGIRAHRRVSTITSIIAAVSALIASFLLPHINPSVFDVSIALLTIISLPLFFSRHSRLLAGSRSIMSERCGFVAIAVLLLLGSVLFSSGLSMLIALALPVFFGTSTLESAGIRRTMGIAQMSVLLVSLHSFIVWPYALAGLIGGILGSYAGTHIAVKKGETLAKHALSAGAVVSALVLLLR
jgi:uncharacterized membrane protein YfcA